MRKLMILITIAVLGIFCVGMIEAADKGIGKLFIKAGTADVGGQQLADPDLADTVKDMKVRHGKFTVVDDESQADYLIVVIERKSEMQSPAGTPVNTRIVIATLSVKDGGSWKAVAKLNNGSGFNSGASWGIAAGNVIKQAEKWIAENRR